ncbi:MAG: FKBP-type peptidyl-prolyl cis-trans isomerase [Bacteroidales bacterium]|nr:FKBP-type peptidyl-prolyl cis-trans isomerase [Bacteroidales bacterium]
MFLCVLYACSTNDTDEKLAAEEQKLTDYITSTYPDAISLGGSAYLVKTVEKPDGAKIEAGNYILWNRQIKNQITGDLDYTSDLSDIKFADSYVDGGPELTLIQSSILDEGLKHMSKGEKGDIYIPSRWLFCDFQPRIFSVEIVDVISKGLSLYHEALMFGYIKNTYQEMADTIKDVISTVDNTEYNVMYHIINKGAGGKIADGMIASKVSISYLIRDNDVHQYAREDHTWNTSPSEKVNTLTRTNCIGEILKEMNRGGEVVVAMPSNLYWEDKDLPRNNSAQYCIPKWSVAIFIITTQ